MKFYTNETAIQQHCFLSKWLSTRTELLMEPDFLIWTCKIAIVQNQLIDEVPEVYTPTDFDLHQINQSYLNDDIETEIEKYDASDEERSFFILSDDEEVILTPFTWNRERLTKCIRKEEITHNLIDSDYDICCICFEECNMKLKKCKHYFHPFCLTNTDCTICPYCRQVI